MPKSLKDSRLVYRKNKTTISQGRFTMLEKQTIQDILKQFPKVLKVVNCSNVSILMIHYGRGKAIEVSLNALDLFDIAFLKAIGTCYNTDKSKEKIKNVALEDIYKEFSKVV